jgi:NADH dehydrogenase [ubiquinone] 1 alpha subcomplex assembly factor 7
VETTPTQRAQQLHDRIAGQVRAQGAVTLADFMRLALGAREIGYYTSRDPLGAAGDFITAPEISQMFGEMLGLWCIDTWQRLGSPAEINLVELGPGRGTLMADALRAAKLAPAFVAAIRLHLVEISAPLRAEQARRLQPYQPHWHDGFESLPSGPVLVLANEFFDALPIHQFQRTESGWRERGITLDPADTNRFIWALLPPGPQLALLQPQHQAARVGEIVEVSPASQRLAGLIGQRCSSTSSAALFIDYGPTESGIGDSFQALRRHRYHDPLLAVGDADLTAHVDLAALCRAGAAAGCRTFGPLPQGDFLRVLGIETRAQMLAKHQAPSVVAEIDASLHRLIDAKQMGNLFNVIAMSPLSVTALAGFA